MKWMDRFLELVPCLGHRNWVLVADAAYPEMSAPGIVTIPTGEPLMPVLTAVLDEVRSARHLRPDVLLDQEWFELTEAETPGICRLRQEAGALFEGLKVVGVWHEELLKMQAEASQTYTFIVLKTESFIPYTSVFLRLECGYWGEEQEKGFRERLGEKRQ